MNYNLQGIASGNTGADDLFSDVNDILAPMNDALERHGILWPEFAVLGETNWRIFIDNLPTCRVDMHLRRQWAKNKQLKPKPSELNDWAFLGAAVAYCDVVVTEKLFADLVNRGHLEKRAHVITDLKQLPLTMDNS